MIFHNKITTGLAVVATCATFAISATAATFDTVYIFGDSYSDTGAFVPLTNGTTAAAHFADLIGSELTLPDDPNPGTKSINFAESAARVDTLPADDAFFKPNTLTQQVAHLVEFVDDGLAIFDPLKTLFFLSGGLNDHELDPAALVVEKYSAQVETLISIGARYIQVATLPALSNFGDSAAHLNDAYAEMVISLNSLHPDVHIGLSGWGGFYDDIVTNPAEYGMTNVVDPCSVGFGPDAVVCDNPDEHFFFIISHPSDAAHRIVGERLYQEALAIAPIPLPAGLPLLGAGVVMLAGLKRRKKAA